MTQIRESLIERRIAAPPEERLLNVILWLVVQMGVWLPLVTLALMLAKGTGILSIGWLLVFLPSLVSVAFGVSFLIGGYGVAALCQWVNSPNLSDPSTTEFSSPLIVAADSSSESRQVVHTT
jgi:hypothetical protein